MNKEKNSTEQEKKTSGARIPFSSWIVLGIFYLGIQIFQFAKGLITHEIQGSQVFPATVAVIVLSICMLALFGIAYLEYRKKKQREK